MFLVINLKNNSKSLTQRKLFGTYFHSISRHASEQYRLFSGRSANTEKEEAFFTGIKTDTKLTLNYQPENLITNVIIRAEARTVLNQVVHLEEKSFINDIYQPITKQLKNTVIPFSWIRPFPNEYQKLLELQADFLLEDGRW